MSHTEPEARAASVIDEDVPTVEHPSPVESDLQRADAVPVSDTASNATPQVAAPLVYDDGAEAFDEDERTLVRPAVQRTPSQSETTESFIAPPIISGSETATPHSITRDAQPLASTPARHDAAAYHRLAPETRAAQTSTAPPARRASLLPIALAGSAVFVLFALAAAWLANRASDANATRPATQVTEAVNETAPPAASTGEARPDAGASSNASAMLQPPVAPVSSSRPERTAQSRQPELTSAPPIALPPGTRNEGDAARNSGAPTVELRSALDEWLAATNTADLNGQMRFYAPRIERYYLRSNFSRAAVEEDKARLIARARLTNVNIEGYTINFSPDGQTATMRFRKNYGFEDRPGRNAVLQELRWRKTADGWRIISERDLRVLR